MRHNYSWTNVGYVFMIGVLSEAYQRTVADSESIWRGAQWPKIVADKLQKCGNLTLKNHTCNIQ